MTILLAVVAGWLMPLELGIGTALADGSPVLTESFESVSGLPAGWKLSEYVPGNSMATIVSGAAADGTHFLRIASSKPNHARVIVPVPVTPNLSYQFHVMTKARGATENVAAAVLGVDGQYTATGSVRTDTHWQPLDLYVKPGPRTTIDLTMGLGHFGQLNVGTAEFDAVTVTQVSAIPSGATVAEFTTAAAAPATATDSSSTQGPNGGIWVIVGILAVVGLGVAAALKLRGGDTGSTPQTDTESRVDAESGRAGALEPHGNAHAEADDRFRT